jgi:hypothetical protein
VERFKVIAGLFGGLASPAFAQLTACPPTGDATHQRDIDVDILKNREDAPLASQFDPNATLSAVLAPGPDLDRWSNNNGAVFEGIVLKVKDGGAETANCRATDLPHRDTHIEIALDPAAPSSQRVIVEVTPRWRQKMAAIADWSTKTLHDQFLGHRVRVTGWLMADVIHTGAAQNTNPNGKANWRATIWEIHPITALLVLPGPAVAMSAARPTGRVKTTAHHARTRAKRSCPKAGTQRCRKAPGRRRKRAATH